MLKAAVELTPVKRTSPASIATCVQFCNAWSPGLTLKAFQMSVVLVCKCWKSKTGQKSQAVAPAPRQFSIQMASVMHPPQKRKRPAHFGKSMNQLLPKANQPEGTPFERGSPERWTWFGSQSADLWGSDQTNWGELAKQVSVRHKAIRAFVGPKAETGKQAIEGPRNRKSAVALSLKQKWEFLLSEISRTFRPLEVCRLPSQPETGFHECAP